MRMCRLLWLAPLVFLIGACSCTIKTIEGSGNVVTETRAVSGVRAISLSGLGEVLLTQTGEESLTVEADDNLMPYLRTEMRGGTLHLGLHADFKGANFRPSRPVRLHLTVGSIDGISISGSGMLRADELEAEGIDIDVSGSGTVVVTSLRTGRLGAGISGSGQIQLGGAVGKQSVSISGSGSYRGMNLASDSATVDVSGSGVAVVWVERELSASISGSGSIAYYGGPNVSKSISGSGRLTPLGPRNVDL